jgi:hypothetical protein
MPLGSLLEFKRLGSHVVVELSEVLFKFVEAKQLGMFLYFF